MGRIGVVPVGFLVIGLLLSTLLVFFSPCRASPLTEVALDLQDESPLVDVSPGSSGIVTAVGTVTCMKVGPDQVKVNLMGESTFGGTNVNPPNLVFGGSSGTEETRTFSATTRVPAGTSCEIRGTLTVSGVFTQGGMQYNIEPDSVEITVLQYHMIGVEDEKGRITELNLSGAAGEDLELKFYTRNEGNGIDVFQVDFKDRDDLADSGFDLPASVTVPIKASVREQVKMQIGVRSDLSGTYYTQLVITSQTSEDGGSPTTFMLPVKIDIQKQSITEAIGGILISPIVILVILVIVIAGAVFKLKQG